MDNKSSRYGAMTAYLNLISTTLVDNDYEYFDEMVNEHLLDYFYALNTVIDANDPLMDKVSLKSDLIEIVQVMTSRGIDVEPYKVNERLARLDGTEWP